MAGLVESVSVFEKKIEKSLTRYYYHQRTFFVAKRKMPPNWVIWKADVNINGDEFPNASINAQPVFGHVEFSVTSHTRGGATKSRYNFPVNPAMLTMEGTETGTIISYAGTETMTIEVRAVDLSPAYIDTFLTRIKLYHEGRNHIDQMAAVSARLANNQTVIVEAQKAILAEMRNKPETSIHPSATNMIASAEAEAIDIKRTIEDLRQESDDESNDGNARKRLKGSDSSSSSPNKQVRRKSCVDCSATLPEPEQGDKSVKCPECERVHLLSFA